MNVLGKTTVDVLKMNFSDYLMFNAELFVVCQHHEVERKMEFELDFIAEDNLNILKWT